MLPLSFQEVFGFREYTIEPGDFEVFLDSTSGDHTPLEVRPRRGVKLVTKTDTIYAPPGGTLVITKLDKAVAVTYRGVGR